MSDTSNVLTVTIRPIDWEQQLEVELGEGDDRAQHKEWLRRESARVRQEKQVFGRAIREWSMASGAAPGVPGPVEITSDSRRWSFLIMPRFRAGSLPSAESLIGLRVGFFDTRGPYGHHDVDTTAAELALDRPIDDKSPWMEVAKEIYNMSGHAESFRFLPKGRSLVEFWLSQPLGRWGMEAASIVAKGNALRLQGKYDEANAYEESCGLGPQPPKTPIPDTVGSYDELRHHLDRPSQTKLRDLPVPLRIEGQAQQPNTIPIKTEQDLRQRMARLLGLHYLRGSEQAASRAQQRMVGAIMVQEMLRMLSPHWHRILATAGASEHVHVLEAFIQRLDEAAAPENEGDTELYFLMPQEFRELIQLRTELEHLNAQDALVMIYVVRNSLQSILEHAGGLRDLDSLWSLLRAVMWIGEGMPRQEDWETPAILQRFSDAWWQRMMRRLSFIQPDKPGTMSGPADSREQQIRDLLLGLPRKVSPAAARAVQAVLLKLPDETVDAIAGLCLLQAEGSREVGQPTSEECRQLRAHLEHPQPSRIPQLEWERKPLLPEDPDFPMPTDVDGWRTLLAVVPLPTVMKLAAIAVEMVLPIWREAAQAVPAGNQWVDDGDRLLQLLEMAAEQGAGMEVPEGMNAPIVIRMSDLWGGNVPFSYSFYRLMWALNHLHRSFLKREIAGAVVAALFRIDEDYQEMLSPEAGERAFLRSWWSEVRRRLAVSDVWLMFPEGAALPLAEQMELFQQRIRKAYPDVVFDLLPGEPQSALVVRLDRIVVPRKQRKQGIGSQIMRRLADHADQQGWTLTLTLAQKGDADGTTSRGRLVRFYKRFGFVENKGRNKDFRLSDSMYRRPRPSPTVEGMEHEKLPKGTHSKYGSMDSIATGEGKPGRPVTRLSPSWLPSDQRSGSLRFPGPATLIRFGSEEDASEADERLDVDANLFSAPFTVVDHHIPGRLLVMDNWHVEMEDPWLVDFDLATGRMFRYLPGELLLNTWDAIVTPDNQLVVVDYDGTDAYIRVVSYDLSNPDLEPEGYTTWFQEEALDYEPLEILPWKGHVRLLVRPLPNRSASTSWWLLASDRGVEHVELGPLSGVQHRNLKYRRDGDYFWTWNDHRQLRLDLRSGERWSVPAHEDAALRAQHYQPIGTAGRYFVYALAAGGKDLYLVDETGVRQVMLEQPSRHAKGQRLAVQGGLLVMESLDDDQLYYAWDVETGRLRWEVRNTRHFNLNNWRHSASAIAGLPELLLTLSPTSRYGEQDFLNSAYRVHALDARTGEWLL